VREGDRETERERRERGGREGRGGRERNDEFVSKVLKAAPSNGGPVYCHQSWDKMRGGGQDPFSVMYKSLHKRSVYEENSF
jgi:hypothetical protein